MGNVLPFQRPPDGGEPTQPCPHCGKVMDADAVRCRHCRQAVVPGGEPSLRRKTPWWVILGVILAILIVLAGILADL